MRIFCKYNIELYIFGKKLRLDALQEIELMIIEFHMTLMEELVMEVER